MATTAIWDVKGWIGDVVHYVENPEKTDNPEWSSAEMQGLVDIMDSAMRDAKERGLLNVLDYATSDYKTEQRRFVSGINCAPEIARQQMMLVKKQWQKEDGIIAFHGYQSFQAGEVTPKQAHEIGVELAKRLWGDRFQVLVATHLNTDHIHNHFVLNSVSFADGLRYYDNKATYREMRRVSDELCHERQLSVIEHPQNRGKHYAEWKAENEGKPTWRSAIREDVDTSVMAAMTWSAFLRGLSDKGYELKTNRKYVAIRPPGKERFVRLRSLGEQYTEDAIRQRILKQRAPERRDTDTVKVLRVKAKGDFILHKVTWKSIRALYYYYLHKLRAASRQPERAPYLLRDDLRYMDVLSEQAKLLNKYGIDSKEQLEEQKAKLGGKITQLGDKRQCLYKEARRTGTTPERKEAISKELHILTDEIKTLKKEVVLCKGVEERLVPLAERVRQLKEIRKEMLEHERSRGRGGSDRQHSNENRPKGR